MKVQTTCFSTYLITIVFFKSDYAKTTWDIKRIVLLVHREKKSKRPFLPLLFPWARLQHLLFMVEDSARK